MKKLLALCSVLLFAVTLSAFEPPGASEVTATLPVVVVTNQETSDMDALILASYDWPEMPFAGSVPVWSDATQPLSFTTIAVIEHPPNLSSYFRRVTINYFGISMNSAAPDKRARDQAKMNPTHLLPFIRWV